MSCSLLFVELMPHCAVVCQGKYLLEHIMRRRVNYCIYSQQIVAHKYLFIDSGADNSVLQFEREKYFYYQAGRHETTFKQKQNTRIFSLETHHHHNINHTSTRYFIEQKSSFTVPLINNRGWYSSCPQSRTTMAKSSLCPPTCVCTTLVVWGSFSSRGIREGASRNALCI